MIHTDDTGTPALGTVTTTAPPPASPESLPVTTPETRKRTMWPIRIGRVIDGGIFPIKGGPEFNEARAAEAWMRANMKPDEMLIPLRVPEKPFKASMVLEEVAAPW